jgi:hypothetical protein
LRAVHGWLLQLVDFLELDVSGQSNLSSSESASDELSRVIHWIVDIVVVAAHVSDRTVVVECDPSATVACRLHVVVVVIVIVVIVIVVVVIVVVVVVVIVVVVVVVVNERSADPTTSSTSFHEASSNNVEIRR